MRVWGAVVVLAAFAGRVVAEPVPLLRIEAGTDVLEAGAAQILSVQVQTQGPAVVVTLDAGLRQALTALTSAHVGEALVLTVCGREVSRPLLYQPVTGGAFAIQQQDLASIQHLAAVLRAKDCESAPSS
jgi:preprotein translocase subunit SecD